jgi:hypothetical protein
MFSVDNSGIYSSSSSQRVSYFPSALYANCQTRTALVTPADSSVCRHSSSSLFTANIFQTAALLNNSMMLVNHRQRHSKYHSSSMTPWRSALRYLRSSIGLSLVTLYSHKWYAEWTLKFPLISSLLQKACADYLLPILLQEDEHTRRPRLIRRSQEVEYRVLCGKYHVSIQFADSSSFSEDICHTTIFTQAWFCGTCGREICAPCKDDRYQVKLYLSQK